jgi:hypothetical protein
MTCKRVRLHCVGARICCAAWMDVWAWSFFFSRLRISPQKFLLTICPDGTHSLCMVPTVSKKSNQHWFYIVSNLLDFLVRRESGIPHWDDCCFVSESYPSNQEWWRDEVRIISGLFHMLKAGNNAVLLSVIAQRRGHKFSSNELQWVMRQNSLIRSICQFAKVFQDSLPQFRHIFECDFCRSLSRTPVVRVVVNWNPSFLQTLKAFIDLN